MISAGSNAAQSPAVPRAPRGKWAFGDPVLLCTELERCCTGGGEDAGEAISVLWRGLRAMLQTGRGGQPLFISMQVARRWLVTACSASPVSHSELQVKKAGKNTQIYA